MTRFAIEMMHRHTIAARQDNRAEYWWEFFCAGVQTIVLPSEIFKVSSVSVGSQLYYETPHFTTTN